MKIEKLSYAGVVVITASIMVYYAYKNIATHYESQIGELTKKLHTEQAINEELYQQSRVLAKEIVLRKDITSLIVDAARSYGLNPMLLAKVIKSESNFRPNPKHALPNVVGPAGVNIKVWKKHIKNNPNSYIGNIYAGAEILSFYVEDSDSLTLALARYKGLSPLGLRQAKAIIKGLK